MGIVERREREKEQRRSDIIDAAERVFFSDGWESATMDDVATEAELAKATLYLYFRSKEELYTAILARGSRIMLDLFESAASGAVTGIEKAQAIGRAYVQFYREHLDYFNAMMYFEAKGLDSAGEEGYAADCEALGDQTMQLVASAVQAGMDDGTIRGGLNPLTVAVLLWGQTTGILQIASIKDERLREHYGVAADDLLDDYFDFILHALKAAQ